MTHEDVEIHLIRRPFVPFTMHMDDGDLIGVRSVEYVFLHPEGRYLFIARNGDQVPIDRFISLEHISQLSTEDGFDMARKTG